RLEPLDVLFFRDGRPFTAASHGSSGLPSPQTLAGAFRTALLERAGCDFSKLADGATFGEAVERGCAAAHHWIGKARCRGPWFARTSKSSQELEVLVPTPANLHGPKKGVHGPLVRLAPLASPLPGWQPPLDKMRPLWHRQ